MLGTCVQYWLHNLWAPVQNENMGLLLVQELLRISKWQAEFQPSLCPSECGAHAACPTGAESFSLKNRFPVCLLPEKSLRFQMSRDEQGGFSCPNVGSNNKLPFNEKSCVPCACFWGIGFWVLQKKEQNNAICSNMDRPRDFHTEWNKSNREG